MPEINDGSRTIEYEISDKFITGISDIEQTEESETSRGINELTFTFSNGETATLTVRNGEAGGFPVPVEYAADMIEQDKIYLYLGNENGYETGYLYAFINDQWTQTSLYGVGQDGYSPEVTVSKVEGGVEVRVADRSGITTATIENGTATDEQVADWLDNHPEATTTVQDGSITEAKLASDVTGIIDGLTSGVTNINTRIDDHGVTSINVFPHYRGHMNDSNLWNQINGKYLHIVVPVTPGDRVTISIGNGAQRYIGFLKSYTVPAVYDPVPFSDQAGFTTKIMVAKTIQNFIVPSDANYLVIEDTMNESYAPVNILEINNYDFVNTLVDHMRKFYKDRFFIDWEIGVINASTGADVASTNRVRTAGYYDIKDGVKITIPADMKLYIVIYDSDNTHIHSYGWMNENFVYYKRGLNEAKFRLFVGFDNDATMTYAWYGNRVTVEYLDIPDDAPVWYAFGDSITQGYYSENGSLAGVTVMGYPTYAALENGWKLYNLGVGGSGYIKDSTSLSKPNAKGQMENINFSDCDICTLAFGVNDWHYNQVIGTVDDDPSDGTTMASNMKWCIEKIMTDNPLCRLNIILPMNCSTYGGDFDSDWGLGCAFSTSGTLQHVIDVIKGIAEYYHLPYIDQSNSGIANRYNIQAVLNDGIHPALETFKPYGLRIAKEIK